MTTNITTGFAKGEHLILRPVQEADLAELARIMAQQPGGGTKPLPWTDQRLRKAFDREDSPGLWGQDSRTYAALRPDGCLVGYIKERLEDWIQTYVIDLHVDDLAADRHLLGGELVRLFLEHLLKWHHPSMILCEPLEPELDKRAWLEGIGFRYQFTQERAELHLGRAVGRCAYAWHSAERGAGVDYSQGEPAYPPHGESRSNGGASVPARAEEVR